MTEQELKELKYEAFVLKIRINSMMSPNTMELYDQRLELKRKIRNEELRIKREQKLNRIC